MRLYLEKARCAILGALRPGSVYQREELLQARTVWKVIARQQMPLLRHEQVPCGTGEKVPGEDLEPHRLQQLSLGKKGDAGSGEHLEPLPNDPDILLWDGAATALDNSAMYLCTQNDVMEAPGYIGESSAGQDADTLEEKLRHPDATDQSEHIADLPPSAATPEWKLICSRVLAEGKNLETSACCLDCEGACQAVLMKAPTMCSECDAECRVLLLCCDCRCLVCGPCGGVT